MGYTVIGLCMEKEALIEKLSRVQNGDAFAKMLIMGRIKAIHRQIAALSPSGERHG